MVCSDFNPTPFRLRVQCCLFLGRDSRLSGQRYACSALTFCSDYINPIDLCNRLNTYIIPEAGIHAFLTFLFLINGYWVPLLLNLPLVAYNAKKWVASEAKTTSAMG